ncbi:unnamed protein product [Nezara viridula]|uniref:Uncharacterized protein n=1 Tax=Nezara viridula TaxID=85310 RepID=A0A9P0E1H8_NEZVI|nr:unnamed protein product [Nezara viridula]
MMSRSSRPILINILKEPRRRFIAALTVPSFLEPHILRPLALDIAELPSYPRNASPWNRLRSERGDYSRTVITRVKYRIKGAGESLEINLPNKERIREWRALPCPFFGVFLSAGLLWARCGEWHLGFPRSELQGASWYQLLHWDSMREAQSKHRLKGCLSNDPVPLSPGQERDRIGRWNYNKGWEDRGWQMSAMAISCARAVVPAPRFRLCLSYGCGP